MHAQPEHNQVRLDCHREWLPVVALTTEGEDAALVDEGERLDNGVSV